MPSGALARHERRGQDREHAKGGDIPEQRGDERYTGYIKDGVSDARADIRDRSPMGQLIVNACRLSNEDRRGKKRKRLHVIAEVAVDAPRDGRERRHLGVARARSPFEAVLRVGGLRRSDELKKAPKTCGCQHYSSKLMPILGPLPKGAIGFQRTAVSHNSREFIAFHAETAEKVDQVHAAMLAANAEVLDAPADYSGRSGTTQDTVRHSTPIRVE
jgi:hypothetical protein